MSTDDLRPEQLEGFWENTFGKIMAENKAKRDAYDKEYLKPKLDPSWRSLGAITAFHQQPSGFQIQTENAAIEITQLTHSILRFRVKRNSLQWQHWDTPFSYAISKPLAPASNTTLLAIDNTLAINDYTLDKSTSQLSFHHRHIDCLLSDNGMVRVSCKVQSEAFYGTGERTFDLNLCGRKLSLWNTDAGSYERGFEPINYTVPILIGTSPELHYGLFVDNTYRGTIDIASTQPNTVTFDFTGGDICFYLTIAPDLLSVTANLTELTGKMPLPPLWSLGFHQSRYSYFNQEEILQLANEFRRRQIPCDAIHLDIHYMQDFKVFTWDKVAFPNFKGMIDELHQMGFKVIAILDPGVKVEKSYVGYESGIESDVFIKYPDGKNVEGVVWPGLTHHPDFTNPTTRNWWANQLQDLVETGVDGIWNDMNEPLYFADEGAISPADYLLHSKEGLGGTHEELHNVYGMQMARASRQALEAYRKDKRVFNFTRSGYVGTQRYASSWTGDNKSTWDNLKLSISMNLNMGLVGQSFTGPDVGGFAFDTTPELLVRWTQACAFFPFYRNHSAIDTIYQEAWHFGEDIVSLCRSVIELRYTLMPYLYTQFACCNDYGKPIMHPVVTQEPQNHTLYNIDDAYMLGDSLLVAPVLTAHTLRRLVYLPAGKNWFNYYTKQEYVGGQWLTIEAPLNTLPLFVREGTVLPTWQPPQSLGNIPSTIDLEIFKGNGSSSLYEDQYEGLSHLEGNLLWHNFRCEVLEGKQHVYWSQKGKYQTPTLYNWKNLSTDTVVHKN